MGVMATKPQEAEISPSPNAIDCTELINEINLMTEDTSQEERIKKMEKLIDKPLHNEHMKDVINTLLDHAMDDIEFGQKFVIAALDYGYHQPFENFRKLYINNMQEIFNKREETRKQSMERLRNCVLLFSKYLYLIRMKKSSAEPFQLALICYMEMLLETSSLKDIRIFAEQICLHGKFLSEKHPQNFTELMFRVRKLLIEKTLPSACYRILLYVFDFVNNKFEPLASRLELFYTLQYADNVSRTRKNNFTKGPREFVYSENEFMRKLINILTIEDTPKPEPFSNRRPVHGFDKSNAAKQPGKPQKKTYFNPSSFRRSYNKGWGHDDRFEKDYM